MNAKTWADSYAALAVAMLLILTAWGNALAMFVFSAVALVIGVVIFGKKLVPEGIVAAVLACAIAVIVALILSRH